MALYELDGVCPTIPQSGNYWVAENATVLGNVILEENASVWFNAVLRGDNDPITIGENTNVQDGSVLHTDLGCPLTLGKDVTIGHMAMLHGCTLGNRVMVGMQAIIMDGAVVEDDVIVAAGSLVGPGKRLESGYLYRGQPARQVRALSQEEKEFLPYVAGNYVRLKDRYLAAS